MHKSFKNQMTNEQAILLHIYLRERGSPEIKGTQSEVAAWLSDQVGFAVSPSNVDMHLERAGVKRISSYTLSAEKAREAAASIGELTSRVITLEHQVEALSRLISRQERLDLHAG